MTNVSYFQRFSQKENHATNNTLLVMRFFYQQSPQKLETVLADLVGEELEIGLVFEQQIKFSASTPDALISQRPLELFFETKRGGKIDKAQIKRHIQSMVRTDRPLSRKLLFSLTRTPISEDDCVELSKHALGASITFVATTFVDIVLALRRCCAPHETDLQNILNDYEEYLDSEDLMQLGEVMTVVPCGTSMAQNKKFRLYFEPSSRPSKARRKFIGLYKDKCVQQIGRINTVIIGRLGRDAFNVQSIELGNPSDDDLGRIVDAIRASSYSPILKEELHRYYLFDELEETAIHKKSRGGIWGPRVFNLSDWLDYSKPGMEYSTAEAAQQLRGKCFD